MADYRQIGSVSIMTDTEQGSGQGRIGDVEGGFDQIALKDHVRRYGADQVYKTLTWMHFQLHEVIRDIVSEKELRTTAA